MADIPTSAWNEVAASNTSAPPDGWPPGSLPTIVYLCDREAMGAIKREWDRNGPTVTSGGSANAQTLTYTVGPTAYVQGMRYSFIAGFTNTGATTLNVSSLGAKAIQLGSSALTGGEIQSGHIVEVVYDGTQFQILALPDHLVGGLIAVQIFSTPGTATYTPTTGTRSVVVEVQAGGGGAGGGAGTGAGQSSTGGGGGGGEYRKGRITSSFSGVTVTVGSGGLNTSGANPGSAGGTSSFGALISSVGGGGGGGGGAQSSAAVIGAPGSGGSGGSGGNVAIPGGPGDPGLVAAVGSIASGKGGDAHMGFGGKTVLVTGVGNTGGNYGGGGSAPGQLASASAQASGVGGQGIVIVWEYA